MSKGVDRFLEATSDLDLDVRVMPESTRTAEEAAAAVGTSVGAIVKSLVFVWDATPILLLVSGPNRVNTDRIESYLGGPLQKADADTVKEATGYSIGGVPPFGHRKNLRTVMDQDLLNFETVWAAAGSHTAVFPIDPRRILEITSAEVTSVV